MKIARSAVNSLAGIALAAGLASCLADTQPASDGSCGKVPVCLSGSICQEYVTRADANGFADGDVIAAYIVDYVDRKSEKVSIPALLNEIELSEDEDKDTLYKTITELIDADLPYEPYSENNMDDCARAIKQEKDNLSFQRNAINSLTNTPDSEKGEKLKNIRDLINKKNAEKIKYK